VLDKRYRATLGHDDPDVATHLVEPLSKFLGIRDGCRKTNDLDARIESKDDLFPHRAAETVREVVHLIQHHPPQSVESMGIAVDHIAQYLSRHDDDWCLGVDSDVTGEKAYLVFTVSGDKVMELLIGQRLNGCGVKALQPRCQS